LRARAPGKLVLSGSYAVLEGAPALVVAVDRYVLADSEREAAFVTEEVAAAIEAGDLERAPWFDASALRHDDRKLGLGSSAAILVASLAAGGLDTAKLFPAALAAHRKAQAGGSGVDVAASCFGGVSLCRLEAGGLAVTPRELPSDVVIEVYACGEAARTSAMLEAVRAFATRDVVRYRAIMVQLCGGSEVAAGAGTGSDLVSALRVQADGLAALGDAAAVPIVTPAVAALDALARDAQACFLPAGAGGGDIACYCGLAESSPAWRARATEHGLTRVALSLGARGVHAVHR